MDASIAQLVERCREGHEDAWRELFQAHFGYVSRIARRLGTPSEELEDVCQETFIVAFKRLEQFTYGRFTTWLYRITANVVSSRHRSRRVREGFAAVFGREERVAPSPDRDLELLELERLTSKVLARMAPPKREVFVLYELEGLTGDEIAERVGIKVDTVWTRLYHARRDFTRLAKKHGLASPARVAGDRR